MTSAVRLNAQGGPYYWPAGDVEFFMENWGLQSARSIARRLRRTVTACKLKAKRLHITQHMAWWSGGDVARLFCVDSHRVAGWVQGGLLHGRKVQHLCTGNHGAHWGFQAVDIERFIKRHPEAYDWRRMEESFERVLARETQEKAGLISVAAASRYLGLCKETIRRRVRQGRLPAVLTTSAGGGMKQKGYLLRQADLDAYRESPDWDCERRGYPPTWGHSPFGRRRYWTRDRVIEALRAAAAEIEGPLPCSDHTYNPIKKGRLEWPTARRIYDYFGGIAWGWLAAGADRERLSLRFVSWSEPEVTYLLEHAGLDTLESIAKTLGRSYDAVKAHIGAKGLGITARANQGFLSAAELAKEYGAPYHRIRGLLTAGKLKGHWDKARNRWQIDPADLTPDVVEALTAPKKTYTTSAPDLGDYYQRYGIVRRARQEATA